MTTATAEKTGRWLPRQRPANRPFFDALDGLVACYEALGNATEAAKLRDLAAGLGGERRRQGGPAEAAGRVFSLNAGLVAFQSNCAGGDKLAKLTTTDGLLGFGRRCLQDSGLVSKDSADLGARL